MWRRKKSKYLHQGIYPWAHDRFGEQSREAVCKKGFMTAGSFKCVTVFQELIPDPEALCRSTLGICLHSSPDAEGDQYSATVHHTYFCCGVIGQEKVSCICSESEKG